MSATPAMQVKDFFDPITNTFSYVVYTHEQRECLIIDPVLDYDSRSARTTTHSAQQLVNFVRDKQLKLEWILETHAHADHVSAAAWLKEQLGGQIAIGAPIRKVQSSFEKLFSLPATWFNQSDGFDRLLDDGDLISVGRLQVTALAVPGHTPACMAYSIGDAVFVGDTLFPPDLGTARCDFPGGDARALYRSTRRLLSLPAATRLYMCHDYPPQQEGHDLRPAQCLFTVLEQRQKNIHVHDGIGEEAFVTMREQRDAGLALPALMLPAIQMNIRAGQLPPPDADGSHYLRLPLNRF
jgi:glyoxylase-like metal-dependent hydrolase (beta-lactamase superfamily II)